MLKFIVYKMQQTNTTATPIKAECLNAHLEYANGIMTVRIKEGSELNIATMKDQFEVQKSIVGHDSYGVLVDSRNNTIANAETRQFMADHQPPGRKATAIISHKNLAVLLMANFYLKMHNPKVPTRLFSNETEALVWLKTILHKTV